LYNSHDKNRFAEVAAVKLALQEGMYKPKNFKQFVMDSKNWGFDAVEVWGEKLDERIDDVTATLKSEGFQASSVCPGGGGIRGSILSGDADEQERAAGDIEMLLECCAKLGGAGLVYVPEFGVEKFMRLYPDHGDFERRKNIFVERLAPLAGKAEKLGVKILLEPLNRYEAFFLITVGQAAEVCRAIGSLAVRIMADLFHMGIEEDNLIGALAKNAELIAHVHLVDTNRKLPGLGDRDFTIAFETMRKNGFEGYFCLECGITGDPEKEIPESVKKMKKIL
jgi:sugar phosphate isomerase/epimerase